MLGYLIEGSNWEQSFWLFGFGLDKKGEAERLEFRSSGKESVRAGMVAMSKQTGGADSGALLRRSHTVGASEHRSLSQRGFSAYCNFMDRKMVPEGRGSFCASIHSRVQLQAGVC